MPHSQDVKVQQKAVNCLLLAIGTRDRLKKQGYISMLDYYLQVK